MSARTVIIVQSDDLAVWVGSFTGLAGVVVGYGLERFSRKRDELQRSSRDVEQAGRDLFGATYNLQEAHTKEQAPGGAGWIPVRADRQSAFNALLSRIDAAGSAELNKAAMNIFEDAKAGGPAVAIQDPAARAQRLQDISERTTEFREAMRRAGLKPAGLKPADAAATRRRNRQKFWGPS